MKNRSYKRGFTIVELLIVVTVIAILAVISIVGYNGVQQRARDAAVLSDADAVESEMARYATKHSGAFGSALAWYTDNGETPLTNTNINFTPSPGNIIDVVTSTTQYCIRVYNVASATYGSLQTAAYKESASGDCALLTPSAEALADSPESTPPVPPTITNYASNPSYESNQTGTSGPNGSTVARVTDRAYSGTASMRATMPAGAASNYGISVYSPGASTVPTYLQANTTYIASVWVYVPSSTDVDIRLSIQGTGKATVTYPASHKTSVKDAWTRIYVPFTTVASGSVTVYVLNGTATTTAGMQFWVDGVMITETDTLYNFADGNTSSWSWSGAQNNSTSTGPGVTSS